MARLVSSRLHPHFKETCLCLQIQEVLAKFMENAVRFELDSSRLRIKYQLSVGETAGIALSTVLEAMEVGIYDFTSISGENYCNFNTIFFCNESFVRLHFLIFDCSGLI